MKQEYIKVKRKETSIKIQASEINSIRVKDIERKSVRVYQDGKIGIGGAVGATTRDELTKQAIGNLSSNISYPYELESHKTDHRDYTEAHYSESKLQKLTESILDSLNEEYNDFIFSESVKHIEIDYSLKNTEGLDLRYEDQHLELGLIVKSKNSPNLFDTFIGWSGRNLNKEKFLSFNKSLLHAERNKVDLPEGEKLPVFFLEFSTVGYFLIRQLNGETYGNKASFFDGKLGQKLFNEKITLNQDNNPTYSFSKFFDAEGVINKNDKVPLIEHGVLKNVFTDKKNAEKFNLPHTGASTGAYDDIPSIGFINLRPEIDSKDITKTLHGQQAIFVMVAAGGEVNADGNYASPVQAAYLFDGEHLTGKLPDFNISNSVFNMLGEDYIGTFDSKDLYFGEHHYITGCYMTIKK